MVSLREFPREFFLVSTGAPMDSVLCGDCKQPHIKGEVISVEQMQQERKEHDGAGCEQCGATYRDTLRGFHDPDGQYRIVSATDGATHVALGLQGDRWQTLEFSRTVPSIALLSRAYREDYDAVAVEPLEQVNA